MAEESKTTLFYILALAGLIISSILFTGRIEPLAGELAAPASLPDSTPLHPPAVGEDEGNGNQAEAALSLPATDRKACPLTIQKTAFYMTDTSELVDNRLVISGTVYASDFITPMPKVLIEIWQAPAEISPGPPEALHYTFYGWSRTDAAGHYKTTVLRPGQGAILPLYYRVRYQNRCPLGQQLVLVDDEAGLANSALASALAKLGLEPGELAGPLLEGPVDIVLPVPLPNFDPSLPRLLDRYGLESDTKSDIN
jgi:hypothetical protein